MSLDDLLTSAREHRQEPDPGRFTVAGMLSMVAGSAVVAFAAYQLLLAAGYGVPYLLLFAVLLASLLARKITAAAHGTRWPPPDIPDPREWAYESPHDHAYAAARQWIGRLASTEHDRQAFARRGHPAMVALIDDRLRLRHGVDRQRDPQRAQALLGEQLWAFVTTPPSRQPTPYQVELIARQIEQL